MHRLLFLFTSLALGFGAGCPGLTPISDEPPTGAGSIATTIEQGQNVAGELRSSGQGERRHRYLVKVVRSGDLSIRMSWNDQDGVDRLLIQGGTLSEIATIDGRERQKIDHPLAVGPGYYTIEIVPGQRAATYNLTVVLVAP